MNKKVNQKLNEILDMEVVINSEKLSMKRITDFENKYGFKLSDEYKDFLIKFNETYIKDYYKFPMAETSNLTPKDGFENIDYLYVGNFIKNAEKYMKHWGEKMLPIGETAGDLICIGVQENIAGKIYFIYHEDENEDKAAYLVANSFNEFILSFEKRERSSIDLDDIEIELDEDLW